MKHEKDKKKKLWVYNEDTGSLTRKNLVFRENAVEGWYENPMTYSTHDPFYVDDDKGELIKRVRNTLSCELQEAIKRVEMLLANIGKLAKKV